MGIKFHHKLFYGHTNNKSHDVEVSGYAAKPNFPMNLQDKLYTIMLLSCLRGLVLNIVFDNPYRKVKYNQSVTTHFFGSTLYC
jgi:hypothetical protein